MRAQQDKTAGGCALIRVEPCALISAHPAGGVSDGYQGGTFRGTKPAASLSSARRPVVEIIKLLLRPATSRKSLVSSSSRAAGRSLTCLWIDGGRGARCPSVSGGTLWRILTPKPCTQAKGELPLVCRQGSTYELEQAPGSCIFLNSCCVSMSGWTSFARIAAYSW